MTPLRQQMIDAMTVRGFSPRTHQSYLYCVTDLARHFKRSPEHITLKEIQNYFLYLVKERQLSDASCRVYLHAIRFLYLKVLKLEEFNVPIPHPKRVQRIPELLSRHEVARILAACTNTKHRMMLMTCYGCGLRVSELVALKINHVNSEQRVLRIEQGKGAKDRQVVLSESLLTQLHQYLEHYRPSLWLFPGREPMQGLTASTPQRVFTRVKRRTGITKHGGIHSLRHAYATHQLEAGLAVHQLQHQLGHNNLRSTLRYVHWSGHYRHGELASVDLVARLEVDHG